jgi:hypothetical protein
MLWEDGRWIAESEDDDYGLVLESDSFDALVERAKIAIKETLEIEIKYTGEIQFIIHAEREDKMMAMAS